MKELIERLLFLARSDENGVKPCFTKVDLSDAAQSCALSFEPVAYEKGVMIDTDIATDIFAQTDSALLNQLMRILLDNAVKYSPNGGEIRVTLSRSRGNARFSVQNGGNPIPNDELYHIFDRFYRSDKARSGGGCGLGLSIAKNLADIPGCNINAESSVQSGTVFTLILKCAE